MRGSILKIFKPLLVTILLLIICEVLSTTLLPLLGLQNYRIPFNVLIVLYFGFKLDSPYCGLVILVIQYVHSFFSIEGWEMGVIAGVIICVVMSFLKDLIHFTSSIITIFITQVFQVLWLSIILTLFYVKYGSVEYLISKFWRFLPESIVLSIMAPFLFFLLDAIWSEGRSSSLGDQL